MCCFLNFFHISSLTLQRNAEDFAVFLLSPEIVINWLIISSRFFSEVFLYWLSCLDGLTSSFLVCRPFISFCLRNLSRTPTILWIKVAEWTTCLAFDLILMTSWGLPQRPLLCGGKFLLSLLYGSFITKSVGFLWFFYIYQTLQVYSFFYCLCGVSHWIICMCWTIIAS